MSEPQVYKAIAAVMYDMAKGGVAKGQRNAQQNYAFRGIDDIYNALAPKLAHHKLVVAPRMVSREMTERTTPKGTVLFSVVVEAEFDFISAEDGSKHTVRTFGEGMDSGDKATNKAMTSAYKYAAFQTFCIPTEAQDSELHTYEVAGQAPEIAEVAIQEINDAPDVETARGIAMKAYKQVKGTRYAEAVVNAIDERKAREQPEEATA